MHSRWSPRAWSGSLVIAALLGGCGGGGGEAPGQSTGVVEDELSFWRDVAPLMHEHCVACHRPEGIAPFSLVSYEDATKWAPASLAAMEARTMPPWGATGDGSCGDFRDSRWLDPSAIDTVAAWIAADLPEGEPQAIDPPQVPTLDGAVEVSTPDYTPEIVGGPLAEFDEYRCFALDPKLSSDRFITGYAVRPGNPAIVHHLLAMPVDPEAEASSGGTTNLEVIEAADAASPDRAGWPCIDGAGAEFSIAGLPVVWAPGQGVVNYPAGTGLRLSAGELIVVQVHYNLSDPATLGQSDRTTLQLRLQDRVEREGYFDIPDRLLETLGDPVPHALEPGRESVEFSWTLPADVYTGPSATVDLYGVFPHMHEYGRRFRASIERAGGGSECAVEVTDWDFGWQLFYFYEQPFSLSPGDSLDVTCDYDTRGATEPVRPGWGTRNEMCLLGVFIVP